jgi:PIN domain nuclease of toxin-antitoxin system
MSRFLLDTNAFLWWMTDKSRLSDQAKAEIGSARTVVMVSAVVAWEIAIKTAQGRLTTPGDVGTAIRANRFVELPVTVAHAEALHSLPMIHKDPFDRLLVSQARVERLTLITSDEMLARYDVPVLVA